MKCPLLSITDTRVGREGFPPNANCIEQDCAWYDRVMARCHLVNIAISAGWLALHLRAIAEKEGKEVEE